MRFSTAASSENVQGSMNLASNPAPPEAWPRSIPEPDGVTAASRL